MSVENIPIRQWQELYRAGTFDTDDPDTLERAGWCDVDAPLSSPHLQDLSQMVLEITHPLILDHYRVYFAEHSTRRDHKYGIACFGLVTDPWRAWVFHVELNSPFQRGKWALFTSRYGSDEPEQVFGAVHDLTQGIHTLADELEHGTEPLFVKGKRAVEQFLSRSGDQRPYLWREGEHSYSYCVYGVKKMVHVAQRLEDVPIEFQSGGAILLDGMIDGMYVYCPEDIQRAAQKEIKEAGTMIPFAPTVRQWQEDYRSGAYESKDVEVQRLAGWWGWHCRGNALAERLNMIAPVVTGIKEPYILDNYRVWFMNSAAHSNLVYDVVQFQPLDGETGAFEAFRIFFRKPDELYRWTLYTERLPTYAPEFGCRHVHGMVKYINAMARAMAQGLGNPPPGFRAGHAVPVNGMYVCCPEDAETQKSPGILLKSKKHVKKKTEVER